MIWVLLLAVIAVVLVAGSIISETDPEGRGQIVAEYLMGAALLAIVLAVSISINL